MSTAHIKQVSKDLTNVLTLSQAKAHLRIPDADTGQDSLITMCVNAGIRWAETRTERVISDTVFQIRIPAQAMTIVLPKPDFVEVTKLEATIPGAANETLYNKSDEVPSDLADYIEVDSWVNPAEITVITDNLPAGTEYLIITADFGMGDEVPEDLVNAIKMMMNHFFDNPREVEVGRTANHVPMGADMILGMYAFKQFL